MRYARRRHPPVVCRGWGRRRHECRSGVGATLAAGWTRRLTATAPPDAARERRAEIASDVHEHLALATGAGVSTRWSSWSVASRALRGVPADVAWRVRLELTSRRFRWHLRNSSTVITSLFVVMLPINVLADATPSRLPVLPPAYAGLWMLTMLLGWTLILVAIASVISRIADRRTDDSSQLPSLARDARMRRRVTVVMGVTWAASAVGRFAPHPALVDASSVAWAALGLSLACYLVLVTAGALQGLLTLGR